MFDPPKASVTLLVLLGTLTHMCSLTSCLLATRSSTSLDGEQECFRIKHSCSPSAGLKWRETSSVLFARRMSHMSNHSPVQCLATMWICCLERGCRKRLDNFDA